MEEAPRKARALGRLLSWSLIGYASAALYAWGVLIVLSKAGTAETSQLRVGDYVLALAVTSPVVPLVRMELRRLLAADGRGSARFATYARLRIAGGVVLVATGTGTAAWFLPDRATAATILALTVVRAIEGGFDLSFGVYERAERHALVARSELIRALLGLVVVATVINSTGSVSLAMLAVAGAWTVLFVVLDLPTVRLLDRERMADGLPDGSVEASADGLGQGIESGERGRDQSPWTLAMHAAPLGVTASLIGINTSIPRFFVDGEAGRASVGVFGAIAYLMAALSLFNAALLAVLMPRFGRAIADGDHALARRDLLRGMLAALVPGAVVAVIGGTCGDELLSLLYNDGFTGHERVMVWLAAAHTLGTMAGIPRGLLTATGNLKSQPFIIVGTVAINIAACTLLVPHDPLVGAAQALLISRAFQLLAHGVGAFRATAPAGETPW